MIGEVEAILTEVGKLTPTAVRQATFVEVRSDGTAAVDMGNSRFTAEPGSGYIPQPGETVTILSVGARHLLFPSRFLPGVGTVLTVSSGLANVQTAIGTFPMPYIGSAPTSGQIVGLSWSEQPHVVGALSVQPTLPTPPPDPGSGAVRSAVFQAVDTGSHNVGSGNYWQAQPWASDSTYGGWFYGTQIADTIPAAATLVSIEFYVSWQSRFGAAPNFGLHALPSKTGQLSFTNVAAWNPDGGWQTPADGAVWFAALKSGGGRLGVGLSHGGFNKFSSRAQDAMSGALRISWRS